MGLARAFAYNLEAFGLHVVVIVGELAQTHEAFAAHVGKLDKDAPVGDAGDDAVEFFAQVFFHVLGLHVLDGGAFGFGGVLFAGGGMLAELFKDGRGGVLFVVQEALEEAVHHHVGVATDGGGEVRVVVKGEAVVPDVLGAVNGFGHGADREGLEHVGFGGAFHAGEEVVDGLSDRLRALRSERIAQGTHEEGERLQLGGIGLVVNAVDHGTRAALAVALAAHVMGHVLVGQEHELFDQLVAITGLLEVGADGFVVGVQAEFHFRAVKGNGTGLHASFAQGLGHAVHGEEFGTQGVRFAIEYGLGLFVGESTVRMDHRPPKPAVQDLPLLVHRKEDRKGKLVFVGAQGAHLVAELFGQHGHDAVHQVYGGGAVLRFFFQGSAGPNVMRHIRDVHPDFPPSIAQRFDAQGIVKVLGIDGVNGEGQRIAEVAAALNFFGVQGLWDGFGFLFDRLREVVGQAVFVEDGVNLGIVVAALTEDFHHFALRVLLGVVPFGQFDHDHVAVFAACELLEGDVKIGAHFAGIRHQKGMLGGHLEGAHVAVSCALHDRHHLPFELAFVSGWKELNAHLIAAKTGA